MGKTGELKKIWTAASNTNVQFNLVGGRRDYCEA